VRRFAVTNGGVGRYYWKRTASLGGETVAREMSYLAVSLADCGRLSTAN